MKMWNIRTKTWEEVLMIRGLVPPWVWPSGTQCFHLVSTLCCHFKPFKSSSAFQPFGQSDILCLCRVLMVMCAQNHQSHHFSISYRCIIIIIITPTLFKTVWYALIWLDDVEGIIFFVCLLFIALAGRLTTNEELEDMLESGNPSIFTSDVSPQPLPAAAI